MTALHAYPSLLCLWECRGFELCGRDPRQCQRDTLQPLVVCKCQGHLRAADLPLPVNLEWIACQRRKLPLLMMPTCCECLTLPPCRYACYLLFQLKTHREDQPAEDDESAEGTCNMFACKISCRTCTA